jgi:peptide/nickel transport system permease protein
LTRFLTRRALEALGLLLGLSLLTFTLMKVFPGDYLSEMELNPAVPREQVERMRESLGIDRSVPVQYGLWVKGLLSGDFGYSFAQRRPAGRLILDRLERTLRLAAPAFLLSLALAIPMGILGAFKPESLVDRLVTTASVVGLSLPPLVSSIVLLFLAYRSGLGSAVTTGPMVNLAPAVALALPIGAFLARTLRAEMLAELGKGYVVAAAARGLPLRRVIWHAFRNSVNPLISLGGVTLGGLLSGSVVVEKVFSIAGLGALAVDSILSRDLYVALNCVMVSAAFVVLANLAADLLLALNDPRVRS